jgi:D-alanyl-D-alanine carboxypeptidase
VGDLRLIDVRTEEVLQGALDRLVAESGGLGAAAAVRCEGLGSWSGASGSLDLERQVAMPADAIFPVYSITKTLIAVCVLRLAELRALDVDEPISRWVADLPFGDDVSPRELLNHTAGVPNYSTLPEQIAALNASPGQAWTFEQFVEHSCHRGLDFPPGEGWCYSNTGYALLKRAVERANATSFAEAVQQHVAGPLGHTATAVVEDRAAFRRLVPGYGREFNRDAELEDVRFVYDPGWVAHGLVASTASEIGEFYQALFGGKLVLRDSLEEITQLVRIPGDYPPGVSPSYGLGLMSDPDGIYGPDFSHGGGGPGYSLYAGCQLEFGGRRVSAAVFCNTDEMDAEKLWYALLAALQPELGETLALH